MSTAEGATGVDIVEAESPDLVIMDPNLPDVDGFDVVTQIRGFSDVPLILLSTRDGEIEKARGLELGADDYIIKPFNPIDLLARVRAVLRRSHMPQLKNGAASFVSNGLSIDFATRQVMVHGEPVSLTPIEYNLLAYLVRNEGKVLPHRALLEKVWGPECTGDTAFLKKYVYRLRIKLHDDSRNPRMLLTERGIGYRFAKPE
jgi:two-component system KDP operon response regulator KdpE